MEKIQLACNWADDYLISDEIFNIEITQDETVAIGELLKELESLSGTTQTEESQNELQNTIYNLARKNNIQPRKFFKLMYKMLINSESGPKLGNYMFDSWDRTDTKHFDQIFQIIFRLLANQLLKLVMVFCVS